MAGISVKAEGQLTLQRTEGSECPPLGTNPQIFEFGLVQGPAMSGLSASTGTEISQSCLTINSPAAFVALPFPTGLAARIIYFRALSTSDGPFDLRLTHSTAGVVTHPDVLLKLDQYDPAAEEVTLVEVQGVGSFEWAAIGVVP